MRRSRRFAAAVLFVLLGIDSVSAGSLRGQHDAAQTPSTLFLLRGSVLDPSRAPVAGARVTAVAEATGARVSTLTDERGEFSLSLQRDTYRLTIAAAGFAEVSETLPTPRTGATTREFVLRIDGVRENVTVGAAASYQTPVVTSATRTSTPLRDVPQSLSIVTSTLIAEQRMQSLADVVRYMPGVGMAQGEGNRDTAILRGNSSTSDFFVDGVRDDVQYFRDLYNVERVEAPKGPNAMIFGRGGGGGVINRVTRQAEWGQTREIALQLGSWDNRRLTVDLGSGLSEAAAARITGVYEDSDSYRSGVDVERYGLNPTVVFSLGPRTTLRAGYEYFHDERTADRGIPSFDGQPVATDASTFFGDPTRSNTHVTVNGLSSLFEHEFGGGVTLRNRVGYGDYDKFYQNVFPGAVDAAATTVAISAYNNATNRRNLFNQADLVVSRRTGPIGHTFLTGVELGRQVTDNFRRTGYFTSRGPTVTSVAAPLDNPTISLPIEFRQSATDADNHGVASTVAVYAQDQMTFSEHVQAVVGLRYDSFKVDLLNNRTAQAFASKDGLLSPRLGLVYKPIAPVSIYGSYSLSYLPRAGEQLASLSLTNQALDPEEFRNYEIGAKWDLVPALGFTVAAYRLDRGNVAVPHPADPTQSLLVDAQRTTGVEVGLAGNVTHAWRVVGGYAYQAGEITQSISATARTGAALAHLPRHSFSMWHMYDISSRWAAGLGLVHRGDIFASTDNLVVLPGYTRMDAGVFFDVTSNLRGQLNVENLFDADYHASAHNNDNITPGSPRGFRVALTTRF